MAGTDSKSVVGKEVWFQGEDFTFIYTMDRTGSKISEENIAKIVDLLYKHQNLISCLNKENEFVTRGSVLYCTGGTKLSVLDIPFDHAIDNYYASLGTCKDCQNDSNITNFGGCKFPSPENYPERVTVTVDTTDMRIREMEKCVPILGESWQSEKGDISVKVWDYWDRKYYDAVTTGSYLTCYYGGLIKVLKVPHVIYPEDYIKETSEKINCYGYAFGFPDFKKPGEFSGKMYSYEEMFILEDMTKYVLSDMEILGKKVRVINNPSERKPDEFVVAMKVSTIPFERSYDFHFARQLSDGKWADKQGGTPSRYNFIDGTDDTWDKEERDKYYNSKSIYFAVYNEEG